jgi:hypothetical protein
MNIALSAVIIFLLLLPPIAFYLAFTLGKFPKSGPKIGLLEGLMLSAVISTLLHALTFLFVKKEDKVRPDRPAYWWRSEIFWYAY